MNAGKNLLFSIGVHLRSFCGLSMANADLRGYPPLRYPEISMANTYSALKRVRQTERRTEFNRKSKTRLRHQIRAMRRAIASKDAQAAAAMLPATFSIIDRLAKTGIIKKNTAARYKSNLHLRVKALSA